MKILEILRLSELGYSQTNIKNSVKCARSTISEVLKRCREVDLTYEKAKEMSPESIASLLYPKAAKKFFKLDPDFEYIYNELKKYPKLNLRFMWTDYKIKDPDGLEYSQFCERFNRWKNESGKNVTMHQERDPGKELFVDWMGDTIDIVVNPDTGEVQTAHFFVSTLGNSGYPFVKAFTDEKLDKWLLAHIHAIEHYGGVPKIIVPDNCKTAVSKPQYYDPVLNPAYWEWAKYYDVAVIPARIREPKDKSVVEESIGWLETWLLGWLRHQTFFSFEELNKAVMQRVKLLCQNPFQKRKGSRQSIFNELDLPALRPLPRIRFEIANFKIKKVPENYHVEYEEFYYSVPYIYHKQQITIRATTTTIEILNKNKERIASHTRRYRGSRYITKQEHMPEKHRKYLESQQWDAEKYRAWAKKIGTNTFALIDGLLSAQSIEEQAYKSCMGILQMSKTYGNDRLENACIKAISMNSYSYTTLKNILKNGQDLTIEICTQIKDKPLPTHENIRGNSYYQ